jgi:hypothetical protein
MGIPEEFSRKKVSPKHTEDLRQIGKNEEFIEGRYSDQVNYELPRNDQRVFWSE